MRSGMSEVLREGRLLCQKPPSRTHPRKPAGNEDSLFYGKGGFCVKSPLPVPNPENRLERMIKKQLAKSMPKGFTRWVPKESRGRTESPLEVAQTRRMVNPKLRMPEGVKGGERKAPLSNTNDCCKGTHHLHSYFMFVSRGLKRVEDPHPLDSLVLRIEAAVF